MKKLILAMGLVIGLALAYAQPFQWSEDYVATMAQNEGEVLEVTFGDITTLNPHLTSSATETAVLGFYGGPGTVFRDWLGNRSFSNADGFNTSWASNIEEVVEGQEYIVTLREGWVWSDGEVMNTEDVAATWTIHGDPEVESNNFSCSVVGDDPVELEILGEYQYRFRLPAPQVNAVAQNDCVSVAGLLPAHVFMPVYESGGAEAVKGMWGVDADVSTIVSGGPYIPVEFRPGERLVMERNPLYDQNVRAADGSPLPGPERWIVNITEDQNQVLSRVITGQADFYWPTTLDQVRAVSEAVNGGDITGELFANIGPSGSVDFITYNFNNTNECKADMFREPRFRQAMAIMIDRDALVQAAVGGLGFPAKDWNSTASAPFDAATLEPFEYDPERGVELLGSIGFTDLNRDGILTNPDTGCTVEFDLQFNSGNERRGQQALVISQTMAPYGVQVNVREVDVSIWVDSIVGDLDYDETGERTADYDAQIWGLAGGDIDNPSFDNGLRINTNLNSWNKSATDVEAWEILMDQLTVQMNETLDLDARVALYNERAELMRRYLPMTPLISPAFHFYTNLGNTWPQDALDANSIESPYRPGGFRTHLTKAD